MDDLARAYLEEPCYVKHFEEGDALRGRGGWATSGYKDKLLYVKVGMGVQKTLGVLLHETYHAAIDVKLRDLEVEDKDRRLTEKFWRDVRELGLEMTKEQVKALADAMAAEKWREGHEEREKKAQAWAKAAQDALVEIAEGEGRNPESLALEEWCKLGVQHTPLKEQLSGI